MATRRRPTAASPLHRGADQVWQGATRDQVPGIDIEGVGDLHDRHQARAALRALELGHVRTAGIEDDVTRIRRELEALEATPVRIGLFGQPGAGKSSLINALTGQPLAEVGDATDTTAAAATYAWEGVALVDLPGFGTERFPAATFIQRFRIDDLDLLLCVVDGKIREADAHLFRVVRARGKPCILVRTKIDLPPRPGTSVAVQRDEIRRDLRRQVQEDNAPVVFVSSISREGLPELERAVYERLEDARQHRWVCATKAYTEDHLARKRAACERIVLRYAGLAAANGVDPVPGLDLAVDLGLLLKMFAEIRRTYGLSDAALHKLERMPTVATAAQKILGALTREGVKRLLARFATREAAKEAAKWVPIVGHAIAATLGFWIAKAAGDDYVETCREVARATLDEQLGR